MNNLTKSIFTVSLGLGIGLTNINPSFAQSSINTNNTGYQNSEQDSSSTIGESFKPFDLIHNMNLNRGNFDLEGANRNIDQEVDNFKVIQQQRLLEMLNQNRPSGDSHSELETEDNL